MDAKLNNTLDNGIVTKPLDKLQGAIKSKTNNSVILKLARSIRGGYSNVSVEPFDLTLQQFAQMVSREKVTYGQKDGPYFLRGTCTGTRKDDAMKDARNLLVIIDGDKSITEDGEIVEGAPAPELVHEVMKAAKISHLIYSSHSNNEKGPDYYKWRLLIPSDATRENLKAAIDAILDMLNCAGVRVAPVKENYTLSQPWYFPRLAPDTAAGYYSAYYESQGVFKAPPAEPEPLKVNQATTAKRTGESVIDEWCSRYPLRGEIEKRGFKHIRDNRYLPPDSTSGIAGALILTGERDRRERLYVHNGSNKYHGQALDSFDLYREDNHGGDFKEAVKAAAEELGMMATEEAFSLFIEAEDEENRSSAEQLPVDISAINLEDPPGLCGDICRELRRTARRPIPLIYPIVALQALSLVAGNREGINGAKLNLLTLAISPSAAGKEHGQAWLAEMARKLKLGRHVAGNISSDVDMIRNLVEGDGRCCYRIDEIQGLFNAIKSKNANTYESKIGDLILSLATSKVFIFSGNHRRQFLKEIDSDIEKLKKNIVKAKDEAESTSDEEQTVDDYFDISTMDCERSRIEDLKTALRWAFVKRDYIQEGWPMPMVSIMGHSTPTGLDSLVTEENIGTGLIGRCLVIRCADNREKLQKIEKDWGDKRSENGLFRIKESRQKKLQITPEASEMLELLQSYYDEDERLNAPVMGAINARIMEQINKVASLLALEEGIAKRDHVVYAFAIVKRSLDDIAFLVQKDAAQSKDATISDIANHTRELVRRVLTDAEDGKTQSHLRQTVLKRYKKLKLIVEKSPNKDTPDLYEQILARMVKVGDIEFLKKGAKERYYLKK